MEELAVVRKTVPVAIIGVSCLMPGATDPDKFWQLLRDGRPMFREGISGRGFQWDEYLAHDSSTQDRCPIWKAAFLDELEIPWREYKMGPKNLQELHRFDLYTVEAIRKAVADAQLLERPFPRERTAVIMGAAQMGPDMRIFSPLYFHWEDALRAVTESPTMQALPLSTRKRVADDVARRYQEVVARNISRGTVSGYSLALGRACSMYDLKGPHFMVNAACASTLAALEHAMRGLALNQYDMAIVGSASSYLWPTSFVAANQMGMLTTEGQPRPFDAASSGTLLGEGAGFLVLRRLDEAIQQGDKIYAVLRGIGGASEGHRGALVSPPRHAQILAAQRAYEQAGYDPESVQYLECHASGWPVLEQAELAAMSEVFGGCSPHRLTIGSVKNIVGYLEGAAAYPGLLRTILALHKHELPAQTHVREPRPELLTTGSPFRLLATPRPWESPVSDEPRRASVNAVGLGGVAYHLTLEAYEPSYHARLAETMPVSDRPEPVAVISVGALMPGAKNSGEFWANIRAKKDQVTEIPPERFSVDKYYDPDPNSGKIIYSKLGGFIRGFSLDWRRLRLPPVTVQQLDRAHQYGLTAAMEALDGVRSSDGIRSRTAVFMADMPRRPRENDVDIRVLYSALDKALRDSLLANGVSADEAQKVAAEAEDEFKKPYAPVTADTLAGFTSSTESALIAMIYGLHGSAATFESTCASTLAALDAAVQGLQTGEYDMAVAGGTYGDLTIESYTINCTYGGLSPSGIHPYDASASGFVAGEGAGALVLKRLSDAVRDGDAILGVIRGIGSSSDGRGKSLLAPNPEGQALAVRRALDRAGLLPSGIQYVEGHGTGTRVGDYTELQAYQRVYGSQPAGSIGLGSVKSMIGHLNSASGAASLIKVLYALRDKVMPPSLHFKTPNPDITWSEMPCRVITDLEEWPVPADGGPRRAAVTSFGMGGTNFHVIVEEPPARAGRDDVDRRAFPLLETVRERSDLHLVASRELRLDRDLFLADHLVQGVPMLPGAAAVEMMVEAAAMLALGKRVVGLRDVHFHRGVRIRADRPTCLRISARAQSPNGAELPVQVAVQQEAGAVAGPSGIEPYCTGTVVLAAQPLMQRNIDAHVHRLANEAVRRDARPLYRLTDDIQFGERMLGERSFRFISPDQIMLWCRQEREDNLFESIPSPCFVLSPVLLDAILHPAGIAVYYQLGMAAIPVGCREIAVYQQLPINKEVVAVGTFSGMSAASREIALAQVLAFDSQTGQVLLELHDLALQSVRNVGPQFKSFIDGTGDC